MSYQACGITRAIWLHMLEGGGRWTVGELAREKGHERALLDARLTQMERAGFVNRYPQPGGKKAYGVTTQCRVPQSVTIKDILDAGAMGPD